MGQCVSSESYQKDSDSGHKYLQDFPTSPPLKEKPRMVEFVKFDQNSRTTSSLSCGKVIPFLLNIWNLSVNTSFRCVQEVKKRHFMIPSLGWTQTVKMTFIV